MMTRILMTAATAALTFTPATAQEAPPETPPETPQEAPMVEPLQWELDTETLREALLAIGSLEPGDVSAENKEAIREMRAAMQAFERVAKDGPGADPTLRILNDIGSTNRPVTNAQLNALQSALTARVKATDATPQEAERAVSMLRMLAEQGGVTKDPGGNAPAIDPMAALAGLQGVDPADMEAAMALMSNIATNGEQGEVFGMDAAIAADVRAAASAFGAYGGQTGNAADQQRIVSDILGGRNAAAEKSTQTGKTTKGQQGED